jgi:tRNA threonylcarbamoyladenosine biosynthesis protein TsaE
MPILYTQFIPDEAAMLAFGRQLAVYIGHTAVIFLYGDLGAGKTTLSRGLLAGLGYLGKVKSPTYTLVEPYQINDQTLFHFDLYRLHDPQELEFIGIHDYFIPQAICLVEWPEQGKGWLPPPDLCCYIEPYLTGRQIRIEACSAKGQEVLKKLHDK